MKTSKLRKKLHKVDRQLDTLSTLYKEASDPTRRTDVGKKIRRMLGKRDGLLEQLSRQLDREDREDREDRDNRNDREKGDG